MANNYLTIKRLPLDTVFEQIPPETQELDSKLKYMFDGYLVKVSTLRLRTFKNKGCECKYCGLKATHFEINDFQSKKGKIMNQNHLNMWAGDVLMTKDHLNPVANGGKDHLNNMVTCCEECNGLKDKLVLPSVEALYDNC